jgi:hypothetical protein
MRLQHLLTATAFGFVAFAAAGAHFTAFRLD